MTHTMAWVGCGRHAEQMLLPQLVRKDVRLIGVCDINTDAAHAMARRYGVSHVTADWNDVLSLPGVDIIGMAVGPTQHRDIALAALKKGLHIFMEKPCGATSEDARHIRDAAHAARRSVGLGFMKRYATANRMARNIIRTEEFGPVAGLLYEYMTAPAYFMTANTDPYHSFYLHHSIHAMDLVRYYAGPVEQVTVFRNELGRGKHLLHVHMNFASGAIGTVVMGTIQSRGTPVERLEIMGDHRRINIDGVIAIDYFRDPSFKADDPLATLSDTEDTLSWRPNFTAAANEDFKGYSALFDAFFRAVDQKNSDVPTIDDGLSAMVLLEAVIAGAQNPGTTISIAEA